MSIGLQGQNLIFLISQPRAGSTLIQRILGSHPDVHTVSEPWLMLHSLYALRETGFEAEYNAAVALRALRDFLGTLPKGEEVYWEALRKAFSFLYNQALTGTGKRCFLDKTPRYYFVIPELYRVFPRAKYIFLVRNPLAVLASILDTWVKDNPFGLARLYHDLLIAPHLIMEGIEMLGSDAIVIRYEELVKDPEMALRGLCDRLELTFNREMVEYGRHQAPRWHLGDQESVYQHSRPVAQYAEKWTRVLSQSRYWPLWARAYLRSLGPDLIASLGYSTEELDYALSSMNPRVRVMCVPWSLAIKAPESYTLCEKLWVRGIKSGTRIRRSLHHRGVWGTIRHGLHKSVLKRPPLA